MPGHLLLAVYKHLMDTQLWQVRAAVPLSRGTHTASLWAAPAADAAKACRPTGRERSRSSTPTPALPRARWAWCMRRCCASTWPARIRSSGLASWGCRCLDVTPERAGSFHMVNTRAQRLRCPDYRPERFMIVPSSVNYFVRGCCAWLRRRPVMPLRGLMHVLRKRRTSCSWVPPGQTRPACLAAWPGRGAAMLTGSQSGGAKPCCSSRCVSARSRPPVTGEGALDLRLQAAAAGQVQPPALCLWGQEGQRRVRPAHALWARCPQAQGGLTRLCVQQAHAPPHRQGGGGCQGEGRHRHVHRGQAGAGPGSGGDRARGGDRRLPVQHVLPDAARCAALPHGAWGMSWSCTARENLLPARSCSVRPSASHAHVHRRAVQACALPPTG